MEKPDDQSQPDGQKREEPLGQKREEPQVTQKPPEEPEGQKREGTEE